MMRIVVVMVVIMVVMVMIMVIMKTVLIVMAKLRMIWKAQVTNHLAKVLCSDNVDGGEYEIKTKKTKIQRHNSQSLLQSQRRLKAPLD